ncbi:hypothetical protein HPG69_019540 [Diceros bicornis minor]|uniref:Transcriptional adapter 3 n=1 Tax=Diceros bicornis minor TaxID=77932 RepID=A0A7J7E5V6_DICBM|nr:hypothetical protein HPG69_019540 [Diceros bicornis minor]
MSELKDSHLQFHNFKSVDFLEVYPGYGAVLAHSKDDGICITELDTLPLELETLLLSASQGLWMPCALSFPQYEKPKKQKLEGKKLPKHPKDEAETLQDLIPGETHIQVLGTGGPARGNGGARSVADKKEAGPLNVHALLKKSEAQCKQPEDWCPFGTLMQCLLEPQVEENVIYHKEDSLVPNTSEKESRAREPAPLLAIRRGPSMCYIPSSWRATSRQADHSGPAGVSGPQRTQRIRSP